MQDIWLGFHHRMRCKTSNAFTDNHPQQTFYGTKELPAASVSHTTHAQKNTENVDQPSTSNACIGFAVISKDETSLDIRSAQFVQEENCENNVAQCSYQLLSSSEGELYIPRELFNYLGYGLLRPLAKLQSLRNMSLYRAVQNELYRRGANGGLKMLDIAHEIAVPGYFREIRFLWDNYSDESENDFDSLFTRIMSFLYWAHANIYPITDLGTLNVEKLMLCYNCRWGETSRARKHFDKFMRQILFDLKDLTALRSWCGILREKTVIDVAASRAHCLTVLDLGTITSKGPFKKWNLKCLFRKLTHVEDFTWLNCDVRTLIHLASVESLKRLVLHITKYDQIFYGQFFARFGFFSDDSAFVRPRESSYEGRVHLNHPYVTDRQPFYDDESNFLVDRDDDAIAIHSTPSTSQQSSPLYTLQSPASNREEEEDSNKYWVPCKPPTKTVYLDYAALSFAYSIFPAAGRQHVSYFCGTTFQDCLLQPPKYIVPLAVFKANTVILNLRPDSYQNDLTLLGTNKKKFAVGLPKEICANIKPNRTSYGNVVQLLDNHIDLCRRRGRSTVVNEVEIHVMVDYYRSQQVLHLCNLALIAFGRPKILRIHFSAAGRSVKDYYKWPRYISADNLAGHQLTVFELTLNCLTFHVPTRILDVLTPTLEEVYMTLSGLPHGEHRTLGNVMMFFRSFLLPVKNLKTIVFRTNTPYFFAFFETLSVASAELAVSKVLRLETLGIVCCAGKEKMLNVSSNSIYAAVENVHPVLLRRLKKLILDGRVWGSLSAEHLKCLQKYMPACDFEAELAPDDCKDLKYRFNRGIYEHLVCRDDGTHTEDSETESDSPVLDDGDALFMRSDYSDTVEDESQTIFAVQMKKKGDEAGRSRFKGEKSSCRWGQLKIHGENEAQPSTSHSFRNRFTSLSQHDERNGESSDRSMQSTGTSRRRHRVIISSESSNDTDDSKNTVKWSLPKKEKILSWKRNSGQGSGTSSDEEWRPGIRRLKRKTRRRS